MSENGKSGWNRSAGNQPTAGRSAKSGVRSAKKVLCALCLVLFAVLGICIWLFSGGDGAPKREATKDRGHIKEVTPAPAPKAETPEAPPQKKPLTNEDKIKRLKEKYGDNPPEYVKSMIHFLKHPPTQVYHVGGRFEYLKHSCEQQIASLLTAEPGALFIQKPTYDNRFDRDFQNAFLDRIDILDTDSEEVKAIKESVEAAKKDLADACRKDGRLPSEVMSEYASNMYDLGKYRQSMEEEIARIHDDPNTSNEDVELFVEAANKMLKEKGVGEIALPNLLKRNIRLQILERRKAREEAAKSQDKKE